MRWLAVAFASGDSAGGKLDARLEPDGSILNVDSGLSSPPIIVQPGRWTEVRVDA